MEDKTPYTEKQIWAGLSPCETTSQWMALQRHLAVYIQFLIN